MSLRSLLAHRVSAERSADSLMAIPLQVIGSLAAVRILSLAVVF